MLAVSGAGFWYSLTHFANGLIVVYSYLLAVVTRSQGTSFGRRRRRQWRLSDARAAPVTSRCCRPPSTKQIPTKTESVWYRSPPTSHLCHQRLQWQELPNNGRPKTLPCRCRQNLNMSLVAYSFLTKFRFSILPLYAAHVCVDTRFANSEQRKLMCA